MILIGNSYRNTGMTCVTEGMTMVASAQPSCAGVQAVKLAPPHEAVPNRPNQACWPFSAENWERVRCSI